MTISTGQAVFADAGFGLYTGEVLYLKRPAAREPPEGLPEPIDELFVERGGKAERTKNGITVRVAQVKHKQPLGGGSIAIIDFELKRGKKIESLRYTGNDLYAEALAFGRLFVITRDVRDRFAVRVFKKPGGSVEQTEALEIARAFAAERGLDANGLNVSRGQGSYRFTLRRDERVLGRGIVSEHFGRVVSFTVVDAIEQPLVVPLSD